MKTQVVHCKKQPYDVYIGRPSKWGNPFSIGVDGTREEVIAKYAAWIVKQPELMGALDELKGKVLGCWCKPRACHGDILVQLAEKLGGEERMSSRKKPVGQEWEQFEALWHGSNHEEKVELCGIHDTTYDVGKKWVSEGKTDPPEEELPRIQMTREDILDMPSTMNLDFVSFDLETSNLKADFSILLTAAIKPFGQPTMVFRADNYPAWEHDRANDRQIVADIAEELAKHAVIMTHYGSSGNFDVPYLRAKMVHHRLQPLPPLFSIDTYKVAKSNFQVSSRRLKSLASFFDIGEKELVEGSLWLEAAYNGSREAMDKIVAHNIQDVIILEKLANLSFPYIKSIPRL